jgi:ketosteroid isomerase-like protein
MLSIRSIAYLLLIACVGVVSSFGQSQGMKSNSRPEDQIAQLERDWLAADAKGDVGSLRRIISDDFIGSSFDGGLLRKGDIIPDNDGPGGFAGATAGETNVRVFGDTAVLMGVINAAGGPQSKQIRVVLVCQKRPEGWQMVAAQMTRVP